MLLSRKDIILSTVLIVTIFLLPPGSFAALVDDQDSSDDWLPGYDRTYPIDQALEFYDLGIQEKIVGGDDAELGEHPWQVSLGFVRDDESISVHFCGGTIVGEKWILTAAHCFDRDGIKYSEDQLLPRLRVSGGGVVLDQLPVQRGAAKITRHPRYIRPSFGSDIALVELREPIEFGEHIDELPMAPADNDAKVDQFMSLTGWGLLSTSEGAPSALQAITDFPVVKRSTCRLTVRRPAQILEGLICGGAPDGSEGACRGDSGGPVTQVFGNETLLIGVISFRPDKVSCGRPQRYTVSTRVGSFHDWVKSCMMREASNVYRERCERG